MVERPIKKSERPAKPDSDDSTPNVQRLDDSSKGRPTRSADRGTDRGADRGTGRSGDKRKKFSREEEPKQVGNLALLRGPKPTKPKPTIVEEIVPEVAEDVLTEETATPTEG